MTALFNALVSSIETSFTADTATGSAVLSNPSTASGLFLGLPVFGTGIPRGAMIASLSPLTLSVPATANGTAVALTTGFLTFSRRLKFWQEVTEQPALFLRQTDDDSDWPNTVLQALTLNAEIWIYSNFGQNPDLIPETPLNSMLDAIDQVFLPDDGMSNRFTLGGLVNWCRINGKTQLDPGDISGQAIAVIPVEITVP